MVCPRRSGPPRRRRRPCCKDPYEGNTRPWGTVGEWGPESGGPAEDPGTHVLHVLPARSNFPGNPACTACSSACRVCQAGSCGASGADPAVEAPRCAVLWSRGAPSVEPDCGAGTGVEINGRRRMVTGAKQHQGPGFEPEAELERTNEMDGRREKKREMTIVIVDLVVYCRPEKYIKMLLSQKKTAHTPRWQTSNWLRTLCV